MNSFPKTMAFITAGAAGMYCGSCMHDNTLARGLLQLGVDVQLIPTYTPIRTDEENVSLDRVFFGGINIFLAHKLGWYRFLSPVVAPLLDRPWLLKWATRRTSSTDPRLLGALTVSMLKGNAGYQKREIHRLCTWLERTVRPDIVQFSNMLIAGCVPALKARLGVPVVITLQGDDIFLDSLPEPFRGEAFAEIERLVPSVDGFLVHSRFYADFMVDYLGIPADKIHLVPLGIDVEGYGVRPVVDDSTRPRTIGYLARLAPEKGFHLLVDAFLLLRQQAEFADVRLHVAGWLGEHQRSYADAQFAKIREAGCGEACRYLGEVDRRQKMEFLREVDLLSVPTTSREPKGLFVLESLAAGVPVVLPDHGAFPELLAELGGGTLVPPNDPESLAAELGNLLRQPVLRQRLGQHGRQVVHRRYGTESMARATWETLQQFLAKPAADAERQQ